MKNKRILFIIPAIILLAYLLWPITSSSFRIEEDLKAIEEKENFLNSIKPDTSSNRPNIILITVDDLGMADVSLYGEGDIETPNIDSFGEQGVVFENAYVTSPVCSPSRASIMTGRYQHRFGFEFTMHERYLRNRIEYIGFRYFINSEPWVAAWANKTPDKESINQQGLPLSEITVADVLKRKGYKTGIIGKWHLGWSEQKRPSSFGFEEQYGFFHSHSLYAPENDPMIVDQKIENDWTDSYIWSGQRKGSHAIYRNYVEIEEKEYLTDKITDESISFIGKHKNYPFFLWISYNAPHTPLQAPKEYVDRFMHIEDPVKRVYRAMISRLDDEIGRLMQYIDDSGFDENTLIFFISDNGGAEYTLTTDNGNYEGGKNTEFEGGVKVPMIIKWTNKIPSGMRFKPMVSSMDIFPTALNAGQVKEMPERDVDGVDLFPYLIDSVQGNPHQYLFWQRGVSKVVRSDEWKLMINDYMVDTFLYNISNNKYENPDVAQQYPGTVAKLSKAHTDWSVIRKKALWPSVIFFTSQKDDTRFYFEQ